MTTEVPGPDLAADDGKTPVILSQLAQASWAYRLVMGRLAGYRWRWGRHEGVHLYAQLGSQPSSEVDPPLGTLFTEELAAEAVTAHNLVLDLRWLFSKGYGVRVTPYLEFRPDQMLYEVLLSDLEGEHVLTVDGQPSLGAALAEARRQAGQEATP